MSDVTPLPRLPAKLREMTGKPGPGYRKCYTMALDGLLPTETMNGRLYVRDADLPAIVALFGLAAPADRVAA